MMSIRILFLASLVFFGCDASNNASLDAGSLTNSRWLLDRAETDEGNVSASEAPQQAAIEFGGRAGDAETNAVSGYNGCNIFSGQYEVTDENTLRFFDIVQTERACTQIEARLENAFTNVLEGASQFTQDNDQLVIERSSRNVRLIFVRTLDAGS